MMVSPNDNPREEGAALLTVLLLVATMSIIAAMTLERLTLATHVAAQGGSVGQARSYAMAMEQIAGIRLSAIKARSSIMSADSGWQNRPFTVPLEGGRAEATIKDGGNCFNLNSLVTFGQDGLAAGSPEMMTQFIALMGALNIPRNDAELIAASATDWIDSDTLPLTNGAEDDAYRGGTGNYLPANMLMAEASELRAVKGVTPKYYTQLKPYVCALPVAEPSGINVNSLLPEQAALIAMLAPGWLDLSAARQHLMGRPVGGWSNAEAFWSSGRFGGMNPPENAATQVKVTTRWFRLKSDVQLGDTNVTATALLDADSQPVKTVRRIWGEEE